MTAHDRGPFVLITAEHAGNEVPPGLAHLFSDAAAMLQSHRGWDPGSIGVAAELARLLEAPLIESRISRLVIDQNRSEGHPQLHGPQLIGLCDSERAGLIAEYHMAHRRRVCECIEGAIGAGRTVVHVGVHTFTPELDGVRRNFVCGLLFDPGRSGELRFCQAWRNEINRFDSSIDCRLNQPYLGIDDGLTTWLRTLFRDEQYLGVELEWRQDYVATEASQLAAASCSAQTLRSALETVRTAP